MNPVKSTFRLISWAGLTAAGALHVVWATGSSWPAKNQKRLARAVVGNATHMPNAQASLTVAGAAFVGATVAAGALGEGRVPVALRRTMGLALLCRAAAGGEAALSLLGLPAPGKQFLRLDHRAYRPLFWVLGAALVLGAKRP